MIAVSAGVRKTHPGFVPAKSIVLAYTMPDAEHLVLRGRLAGDSVDMRFKRRSEQSYLLVNRGFHLVNEAPLFR